MQKSGCWPKWDQMIDKAMTSDSRRNIVRTV